MPSYIDKFLLIVDIKNAGISNLDSSHLEEIRAVTDVNIKKLERNITPKDFQGF